MPSEPSTSHSKTAAFSGTVLVQNPESYFQKKTETVTPEQPAVAIKNEARNETPLKLSIN